MVQKNPINTSEPGFVQCLLRLKYIHTNEKEVSHDVHRRQTKLAAAGRGRRLPLQASFFLLFLQLLVFEQLLPGGHDVLVDLLDLKHTNKRWLVPRWAARTASSH